MCNWNIQTDHSQKVSLCKVPLQYLKIDLNEKNIKFYFTDKPMGICAIIFIYLFFQIESQNGLMRASYFMKLFRTIIYSNIKLYSSLWKYTYRNHKHFGHEYLSLNTSFQYHFENYKKTKKKKLGLTLSYYACFSMHNTLLFNKLIVLSFFPFF